MTDLVPAEAARLSELEIVIEKGMSTFVAVGEALMEIRELRLYRETHRTFADYCRDRWGFSDSRGRQLIAAAKTVTDVTARGLPAPTSEGEARRAARELRDRDRQAIRDHLSDTADHLEKAATYIAMGDDLSFAVAKVMADIFEPSQEAREPLSEPRASFHRHLVLEHWSSVHEQVHRLRHGRAHEALGYASWDEYLDAEFGSPDEPLRATIDALLAVRDAQERFA